MSGLLQDSTDPELRVMKQETEAKLATAEKGAGARSTAQDTDAGIAMAVALSAVTGGVSNIIDVVVTTLQEIKSGPSALPSAPSGNRASGRKISVSRFTNSEPETPKSKSVDLMSPVAVKGAAPAKPQVAGTARRDTSLDGGGIKLAKQSLSGISGAKAKPSDLVHPALDAAKLKFELGAIKGELEKDSAINTETQVLSRRDEEKLNRGVDNVEKKTDTSPKLAEKMAPRKPPQPAVPATPPV